MRHRALIATLVVVLAPDAVAQPAGRAACDPAVSAARCGTLSVPEDRAAQGGRRIDVGFAVLPATDGPVHPDPLLVLLGGPGESATDRLRALAAMHAAVNRTRDVVAVDQRGTGRSHPLRCAWGDDDQPQSYLRAFVPLDAVRACVARLGAGADLARYRTRDFVADLEALRESLGIERWNLHGSSYGTRVALHYLQRHPERIRSAVLVGVVPPEMAMPLTVGADADGALDRLATACAADAACAAAFPRFRDEVDSVAARLERRPATVTLTNTGAGRPLRLTLTRGVFGEVVRTMMYSTANASALPLAVHEAYAGDHRRLTMEAITSRRALARSGTAGLYLAVTCAEDVARVDPDAVLAANLATTIGLDRPRQHLAACAAWPTRPDGEEWPPSGSIRVPILMLVGEADPATPPHWARVALRTMENGRLIVVPAGGHGFGGVVGGECLVRLQAEFVRRPVPAELDTACLATVRRPPFVVRR